MSDVLSTPQAGAYRCILADPPWRHVMRSAKGVTRRHAEHHYQTMSREEIMALPVAAAAARDCHLFMWTTWPHLPLALEVMPAWGFAYSSGFQTWLKLNPRSVDEMFLLPKNFHFGMGYTSRKNSEILLLGRRGNPKRLRKDIPELLFAARREHSRKPDLAYERIEAYCDGPRLEMFSRQARPGWDAWGNEVDRFPAKAVGIAPAPLPAPETCAENQVRDADMDNPSFLHRLAGFP